MFKKMLVLTILSFCGCATVDPRPDYEKARMEIRARTGIETIYDPEATALSANELDASLADGLGLEEAMRLALLNNRRLQAGFMALGVARADYVQAGLLKNPSLGLGFLFPDGGGKPKWTTDLTANLSELWQLPLRRDLAQAELDARILELSRFAGELLVNSKASYFESVAAREQQNVAQENLNLAKLSLTAVRRQVEEGVATKVEENLAENLALSAELNAQRIDRLQMTSLRRLASLLSLEGDLLTVPLMDLLQEPSLPTEDRESLVERSRETRADLRAAKQAIDSARKRFDLEQRRKFGAIDAGMGAERPEGGSDVDLLVGPLLNLELPLFDQNQAQIARARFRLAELEKEQEALWAEARQQIRSAVDNAAISAKAAIFVKNELLPQAARSAELAKKSYELGDATVLSFLQTQRALLEARRMEIEARLEAAQLRIELERALGAPLTP